MKTRTPALGLLLLSIILSTNCLAQKVSFTTNGGMTIGLGAGASYQKSDLVNSKGYGFDLIIGSQLYRRDNAFLSVDWKFRFLAGVNKAYDHRINPDDSFSNIRYNFFNYDLELGLTLNRLRERTGIVITGFAGAGLTHGRTFTDLYDAGNNLYDFSSIDPNRDSKLVYNDLVALSDGDFETHLVNKAAILPTAGLYIGYQISSAITLGIEYKTNFYLTEENSLIGIDLDNRILDGSGIDRNNYVSLGFGWAFRGGSSRSGSTGNLYTGVANTSHTTGRNNQNVMAASLPRPSVAITDPASDPYHTTSHTHTIRATITNVSGSDNIRFYQNGFPNNNFTYNVNTNTFIAGIRLRDGENSIRITAANQTSTAEDLVRITLDPPLEEIGPAPVVAFTSPSETRTTSASERIDVTARVTNISSKENIQLTLNGRNTPFDYFPLSGSVKTRVVLAEGDNNLLIKGYNETGSAQDELTVYFRNPEEAAPPAVRITNPEIPVEVSESLFPFRAETHNVHRRRDVQVRYNGAPVSNFTFNPDGTVALNLYLAEGGNSIEVVAENEAGSASDETYISYVKPVFVEPVYIEPVFRDPGNNDPGYHDPGYRDPGNNDPGNRDPGTNDPGNQQPAVRIRPPAITIIQPESQTFRTRERSEELRATVMNVNSKENITLRINGKNSRDFNFIASTKLLTTRVALSDGRNVLTIEAQNESGSDVEDQVFIKEDAPCTPPSVRFSISEVNRNDATHEIMGTVTGVKNKSDISIALDGRTYNGYQYSPVNGTLSAKFKLTPGTHSILVTATNACGSDTDSQSVSLEEEVEEEACGIRVNPGNSDWQFCLVTPSGTFSRENLTNRNFSYSGRATSLFFQPIGGGGTATVNGRPYPIRSGQYYLFTGSLNVTISTHNPGAMGQWSVCISASRAPATGNGANRPKSPCESETNPTPSRGNRSRR